MSRKKGPDTSNSFFGKYFLGPDWFVSFTLVIFLIIFFGWEDQVIFFHGFVVRFVVRLVFPARDIRSIKVCGVPSGVSEGGVILEHRLAED